jgi:hypothetical protein
MLVFMSLPSLLSDVIMLGGVGSVGGEALPGAPTTSSYLSQPLPLPASEAVQRSEALLSDTSGPDLASKHQVTHSWHVGW